MLNVVQWACAGTDDPKHRVGTASLCEPLPTDQSYQVLSVDAIKARFPGFTQIFATTGTACSFSRLPQKVLGKMERLCRSSNWGHSKRLRTCQTATKENTLALSPAEQELVVTGQAPKCVVAEVISLHHVVR